MEEKKMPEEERQREEARRAEEMQTSEELQMPEEIQMPETAAEDTGEVSRTEGSTAEQEARRKKELRSRQLFNLLIACAVLVVFYGIWNLISMQKQYGDAREEYERVREMAGAAEEQGPGLGEELGFPKIDLEALKQENPETVAWLYYPALGINYPVMQDTDNKFYIRHTFSGEKNTAGSIFLDAYGKSDFSDDNTFLYGHDMRDGTMFGRLKEIRENGMARENPYFGVYLEDGWHVYQIFSYHEAPINKDDVTFRLRFDTNGEFDAFVESLLEASEEDLGVEVKTTDRIVTLSTCTSDSKVRLVVHGVLVE